MCNCNDNACNLQSVGGAHNGAIELCDIMTKINRRPVFILRVCSLLGRGDQRKRVECWRLFVTRSVGWKEGELPGGVSLFMEVGRPGGGADRRGVELDSLGAGNGRGRMRRGKHTSFSKNVSLIGIAGTDSGESLCVPPAIVRPRSAFGVWAGLMAGNAVLQANKPP